MAIKEEMCVTVQLHGAVGRAISSGFYLEAAQHAYHGTSDEKEKSILIQRAMDAALSTHNLLDCGRIAAEFSAFITDEQRNKLTELVPKIG
jgi:hypothetical protein